MAVGLRDFVDDADVGVVQAGCGAGLTLEAVQQVRRGSEFVGEDLEGDAAVELQVLGQVHFTHTAVAKGPADFVLSQLKRGPKQSVVVAQGKVHQTARTPT